MLNKQREGYEEAMRRSKVLDKLVPYTSAVHLQDSLQALARMDEPSRNAAIDRVIEALKKKEEEERRAQEEADREENAIIAQWSAILEKLPEEHKRPDGLSYFDMTNEQREAEEVAIKKINASL